MGNLYELNDFFFLTVCDGTSSDYFEKVIEDRLHVPPVKQSGMQVKEEILFQLQNRSINQSQAADILGISVRQVKRLWEIFKKEEAEGLISKAENGLHQSDS